MSPILHTSIPHGIDARRLPGISPLDPAEWLVRDEVFAEQMALRDRLLTERPGDVVACLDEAVDAAQDLLDQILDRLVQDGGYDIDQGRVTRPDGVVVVLNRAEPMRTLGHLVQSDFCLLEKPEGSDEHVLTAAVLCFPAGWTLSEKIGRPLLRIHKPVKPYDADIAKRVQRLFDGVRVGQPLWRFNALRYVDPSLFQPRHEGEAKYGTPAGQAYIRSERQTILRLPCTGAVVFGIHTYVIPMPEDQKSGM